MVTIVKHLPYKLGDFEFRWACTNCYRIYYQKVWVDIIQYDVQEKDAICTLPLDCYDTPEDLYPNHLKVDIFPLQKLQLYDRFYPAPGKIFYYGTQRSSKSRYLFKKKLWRLHKVS